MQKPDWWNNLDQEEKQILILISMIPPPVSLDNLIDLTSISAVKVLRLIENLKKRKAISVYDSLGNGYYNFRHPKLSEFVLQQISDKRKQVEAKKLISFFDGHLEEGLKKCLMMTHFYQISALKPKDFGRILSSAEYCLSLDLKDDAAGYYRIVLDNLSVRRKSLDEKGGCVDATLGLIMAHGHLIPLSQQKALLKRSLRFAEELKDKERLARLNLAYAQIWKTGGNYKKAAFFFDEGWSIAQELGKEDLLKKAALSTTDFLFWQGRVAEAVKRYEQVIGNLEEFSSDETTLRACAALGWCYGICGQTARGIGLIEAVRMKAKESRLSEVKIYADLMTSLTLIEARRISEAEAYLNQILRLPEEILGHYVLWAVNAMMAYVRFHYGDLKTCFKFQNRAHENSKKIGWPHHRGPWNFEYIDALEDAGMVHPEMNYESELQRIFNWPDIYMKGVAFRYKAQRDLKHNRPRKQAYKDLGLSSNFLTRAGAKLELSRTQILMARLLFEDNKTQKAQKLLLEAWKVISNVNEDIFPADLKQYIVEEDQEELLIRTIVEVGNTLGTVRNEKKLLERIINLTMRFTTAERGGFFLLNEKGQLDLVASRNLDSAMVNAEWFKSNYRIVHDVAISGKGVIDKGSSGPNTMGSNVQKSGFKIFSPIILQDQILGVLYLDSSIIRRHLADKDLPLLTAIGNQVAIALDNVRAYEEISELKDRMKEETRFYRMELELPPQLEQIVGHSDGIRFVQNQIKQVAPTDSTALISGETGVGKELVARSIHGLSARSEGPFIPVNIASLSESLIESELFGHEKGAFTGASQIRRGRFELAHNGTLFLDDIENLSSDAQIKLLRILQERVFERVGGTKTIKSDFRLIAATNQDLEDMIKKGAFRSDLYFRINVFPIHIPPLRERKNDIALLASHFLEIYSTKMRKGIKGLSKYDIKRLTDYSWPGNVRELQHVIERAVILTTGESLRLPNLEEVGAAETSEKKYLSLEEMERAYIIEVLEKCNWRVSGDNGAAKILNLRPSTLYSKIKRLGIQRKVSYIAL